MTHSTQALADFWQQHLKLWQTSGMTQAAYCRNNNLVTPQFTYWKGKLMTAGIQVEAPSTSSFIRVDVEPPVCQDTGLTLSFANGTRLEGITQQNLAITAQLIQVLR